MKNKLNNALRIALILFIGWLGYVLYNWSNAGRYETLRNGDVIDTHTGVTYESGEAEISDLFETKL
ncbi:hypothetical protein ES702_04429 [subsurface metagenome]